MKIGMFEGSWVRPWRTESD